MILFYIDESGNTGRDLSSMSEPVHWLCAIGLTPQAVRGIEADMLGIAIKYFPALGHSPGFEFHGSDIFAGRKTSRSLTVAQRIELYSDIVSLVCRHDIKVWVRGIHKGRHQERASLKGYPPEHPHKLGFMYLVESLDWWMQNQQPDPLLFEGTATPALGLLVVDTQDEVREDLVGRFANWRQSGTDHGYLARDIKYFIDTVHSVPSHDSWLIQLVDCLAYLRNRLEKIRAKNGWVPATYNPGEQVVHRLWTDHCAPALVDERIWPQ